MSSRRTSRNNINLSKQAYSGLSDFRRAEIKNIVDQMDGIRQQSNHPAAIAHSTLWKKHASLGGAGAIPRAASHTEILGPEVYSPLFQIANLNLPRDRVTMNAWNRIFYDTHPLVRNAINLHASFPISKINIRHKNKKVQRFFEEMADEIDLYNVVYGTALEFWKMGEAFPYAELDRETGKWKRITILNPDYVHVKKSVVGDETVISMRPDASLQRIVNSQSPVDLRIKSRLPAHIVQHVKKGQNIPLDGFNVSHLKLLSSPYDIRGTSVIVSIYKDLMLYDKIRESKFAQADGMINPITLVKLGGDGEYRPTQSDIEEFRQTLEEAQYDKDFKLVTHNGVTIERVGFSGATLDTAGDFELIINNIYAGLMVPKALMDQESVTYASSSVGLEVLKQRYDIFRNMMKKWLEKKIFAPICEIQEFFEYKDGEKVLQVPTIDFNHMNLYDTNEYIQTISQFVTGNQISYHTMYRTLGLDPEEEDRRMRQEMVQRVIRQKEEMALGQYSLADLRNLDPDDEIREIAPESQPEGMGGMPGEEGLGGLPGVEGPGGLGGGGGLGGPPLPPPGPGGPSGGPSGSPAGGGGAPPLGI